MNVLSDIKMIFVVAMVMCTSRVMMIIVLYIIYTRNFIISFYYYAYQQRYLNCIFKRHVLS